MTQSSFRGAALIFAVAGLLALVLPALALAEPVTLQWSQTYSGPGVAEGIGVTIDSGALYVTGVTASALGSPGDLFLLKYDLAGNLAWARTWGGSAIDGGAGPAHIKPLSQQGLP